MTRILWLSRHKPLEKQLTELKRMFGKNAEIVQDDNAFEDADDVAKRFADDKFTELVFIGPLSVIYELCRRGLRPLKSDMQITKNANEADVIVKRRMYKFVGFKRYEAVLFVMSDIKTGGVQIASSN